jgi:hypothetical protein
MSSRLKIKRTAFTTKTIAASKIRRIPVTTLRRTRATATERCTTSISKKMKGYTKPLCCCQSKAKVCPKSKSIRSSRSTWLPPSTPRSSSQVTWSTTCTLVCREASTLRSCSRISKSRAASISIRSKAAGSCSGRSKINRRPALRDSWEPGSTPIPLSPTMGPMTFKSTIRAEGNSPTSHTRHRETKNCTSMPLWRRGAGDSSEQSRSLLLREIELTTQCGRYYYLFI